MKKQKIIPAIIIVLLLAINVFTLLFLNIVNVTGDSMAPVANDGDKFLAIRKPLYRDIKRGDIVGVRSEALGIDMIKRVVALPGEHVEVTRKEGLLINGERLDETYLDDKYKDDFSWVDRDNGWTLADDEVFLMGDNRAISTDSRSFGPLKIDEIDHKIVLKLKNSKKR